MIKIIDCGSQFTQNIARRISELEVYSEIVRFDTPVDRIKNEGLEGLIISGGQFSVYDENAPIYDKAVLDIGVPILGICYGQQSIAHLLGGKVKPTENREYGETKIILGCDSPLFRLFGFNSRDIRVWMSHGDIVEEVPEGFRVIAKSQNGHIAAMYNLEREIYTVQFHPEVDHTEEGREMLDNFLKICKAKRTWDPSKDYDRVVEEIKEKLMGRIGIGGISGGVDSTTVSVLIGKIVGNSYHPIFVDNGLLRLNEAGEVKGILDPFELNVNYVDAAERFLKKLKGITDPEEKRKIIGNEFVDVFIEKAQEVASGFSYFVQGTLYPDVIESVPVYGASSIIKSHHNVGALGNRLKEMGIEIVEPFRNMFKDEVRKIAEEKLDMPKEVIRRHPSPGPASAIRIIGDITPEKLDILRQADNIFIDELRKRDLYYEIGQAFAVLTNIRSVGVKGDEGTYESTIALRAVTTNDFMTSDWFDFSKKDLTAIVNRIINEVKNINRVVYDVSQKPPSTIEWE